MMKESDKRFRESGNPLFDGIQGEVAAENAPLLNFITRYAVVIAGCAIAVLLVLGGMAVWNWHTAKTENEILAQAAKIMLQENGEAKYEALRQLASTAPASSKFYLNMTLAQLGQANGRPDLAAEAYRNAAALDENGSLGLAAAIGGVGALMSDGKYEEALVLAQELENRLPAVKNSVYLQQLTADAAIRCGKKQLAMEIFRKLSDEAAASGGAQGAEEAAASARAAYFKKQADNLATDLSESPTDKDSQSR